MGKVTAWRPWVRGLLTTVISGIAHSVVSALTAAGVAPDRFNLAGGLHNLLTLIAVTGVVSGLISLFLFLQKSPIPEEVEVQTGVINPAEILKDKQP